MIWLSFIWFTVLYGAGIFYAPNEGLFSPIRFVSIKFAFFNLPFILFTAIFPHSFLKGILMVCHTDVYSAFFKYTLLQTLAYVSLIAGILLVHRKKKVHEVVKVAYNYKRLITYAFFIAILAFGSYFYFLFRIGGLLYLLTHLKDRILLQQGQYYLGLLDLLPILLLTLILFIKQKKSGLYKMLFFTTAFISIAVLTSFGGRKPSFVLIAISMVGWYYYIGPVVFKLKTFIIGIIVVSSFAVYLITIPEIRKPDDGRSNVSNKGMYALSYNFVYQLSYVYIDVFAANYFNEQNAWYMSGYFAPVKAFGYSGDKGNIAQVDQGVYFKSIFLKQKDFRPPLPRKELSPTSWPTENFGFAVANFAWWGIIIFFILQGMVFGWVYKHVLKYLFNPVSLVIYVNVILQFNFSSLRLAFFLKSLPIFCICWVVFNTFVVKKNKNQPKNI